MNSKGIYIWLSLFFLLPIFAVAQIANQYNIHINNGLPANHIYGILKDHLGYLWIGTTKGAVKYNGYNFKEFNTSSGLSDAHVKDMYQDKKGRVWLFNYSDEVGYAFNDHFKKAFVENEAHLPIKSRFTDEHDSGICFFVYRKKHVFLYAEHKDIFSIISLDSLGINDTTLYYFMDENISIDKPFYIYTISNSEFHKIKIDLPNKKITIGRSYSIPNVTIPNLTIREAIHYKNYFATWYRYSPFLYILNTVNGTAHQYRLFADGVQENIHSVNENNGFLYISGDKTIFKKDMEFNTVAQYPANTFINDTGENYLEITQIFTDSFWDNCISTAQYGLYLNYNAGNHFVKVSTPNLTGYQWVGNIAGGIAYWWNHKTKSLVQIKDAHKVNEFRHDELSEIQLIQPYNNDSALMMQSDGIDWINNNTGKITKIMSGSYSLNAYVFDPHRFYLTFLSKPGIDIISTATGSPAKEKTIGDFVCSEIYYDSLRNLFWAHGQDGVMLVQHDTVVNELNKYFLNMLGIKFPRQIITDRFGNIFIEDDDKLLLYNSYKHSSRTLFSNFVLRNTNLYYSVYIKNDMLIVICKAGIIFTKILGTDKLSRSVIYKNVKNLVYGNISDAQVSDSTILLYTDKGLFTVNLPAGTEFNNGTAQIDYHFILNYKDTSFNLRQVDTVQIDQDILQMHFDIINPQGIGSVRYAYRILDVDTMHHNIDGNIIVLPKLKAGRYYTLVIIARDNVWRSKPTYIRLYIVPYWWQTPINKRLLWASGILLVALLFFMVAYITRRIVTKKTAKRNLQLEAELKSIYAQINPHFIFNSLSTALYFIKMKRVDDAYTHVFKFSRLLRAYIKSSRNKFITVAEEVVNLKHYIELQQTRFNDKFDYQIIVDPAILEHTSRIPSLLLQPIVENAINHGLIHKETKGLLTIEFKIVPANNSLICIIDDDGIGRKQSRMIKDDSSFKGESYGDTLIKDLVRIFNNYEQMNIDIKYIDKELPATGTTVEIYIKNRTA